jgi:hypothetical protein
MARPYPGNDPNGDEKPWSGKKKIQPERNPSWLDGRIVVLPTEAMEVYKAFAKELVDSLHPEAPMERQLAQTVADTQWRLNRARSFEGRHARARPWSGQP